MMVARASGRRNEPKSQVSSDKEGGKYLAEGTYWEESANKSDEWSGDDTEGSTTEEEVETVVGAGGVSETRMMAARVLKGSGAGPLSRSTMTGRGNTWVVTSEAAYEAGVVGRHGVKQRGKGEGCRPASPLEWGAVRGAVRPPE